MKLHLSSRVTCLFLMILLIMSKAKANGSMYLRTYLLSYLPRADLFLGGLIKVYRYEPSCGAQQATTDRMPCRRQYQIVKTCNDSCRAPRAIAGESFVDG